MVRDESLKIILSRYYHDERYSRSLPATFVKLCLEGGYWVTVWSVIYAVGILSPLEFTSGLSLFSTGHIGLSVSTGGLWLKSEWCEMTLGPDEI